MSGFRTGWRGEGERLRCPLPLLCRLCRGGLTLAVTLHSLHSLLGHQRAAAAAAPAILSEEMDPKHPESTLLELPFLLLEGPGLTAVATGVGNGVTGKGVAGAAGGDGSGVAMSWTCNPAEFQQQKPTKAKVPSFL